MDFRLIEWLLRYQEEEFEAIERWFNYTQPLALGGTGRSDEGTVRPYPG